MRSVWGTVRTAWAGQPRDARLSAGRPLPSYGRGQEPPMNTATLTLLSWIAMIALYAIRAHYNGSEAAEAFWNHWFRRETGILDRGEAIMWLPVIFLNWRMFLTSLRQKRWSVVTLWFLIMGLGTIVLFGEEISWGQAVFGWKPGAEMTKINAQHETNFHNLNLSLLMGLDPNGKWYA